MYNAKQDSSASAQQEQSAPQTKPVAPAPMHPPVHPLTTPMYYSIGQTPPYPWIYAISSTQQQQQPQQPQLNGQQQQQQQQTYTSPYPPNAYAPGWAQPQPPQAAQSQPPVPGPQHREQAGASQPSSHSSISAPQYPLPQQPKQQAFMQFQLAPPMSYMPTAHTHYIPTPQQSPVPRLSSPPSLSPGIASPPTSEGGGPLTPITPGTANTSLGYAPSTYAFKVGRLPELSAENEVKHFAQLVVEIFMTRPDEVAFPLVDAMVTREFNTQRRKHEDSMMTSDLERKDENGYYVCHLCGPEPPRYLHLKSLVRHTSTHFVTKPFVCLFCEDRFTRTDVARKHLICCRTLRASLARFGPERANYIQRVMASAQRCMPGMNGKDRRHSCHKKTL